MNAAPEAQSRRQLLTLGRLEGGGGAPQPARIDLAALVAEVAADAEFEAAARDRHVRLSRCDQCAVIGAPQLLRSAIENVMRNAVQYTVAGSEVEVALSSRTGGVAGPALVEIRDRGPGVPDEALQRIFEPFYRASGARERASGGTGLGLAITDRAIRLHGGSVRARNAPGGGLVVAITLPSAGA